jgi:hypothetical protein
MRKCKVCGKWFILSAKNKYTIPKREISAIVVGLYSCYEAFDCPKCGCQNIVNIRRLWQEVKE